MDELTIHRKKQFFINSKIAIRQPSLDEICDYGEQAYLGMVRTICSTPADRKVEIWKSLHIFWDQVDEFDLFISISSLFKKMDLSILIPDIDFSSFELCVSPDNGEKGLRNKDGVVIDRAVHSLLTDAIRSIHHLKKNTDVGYDNYTKEIMIEDDEAEQEMWRNKPFQSLLWPLISALTNCPEFKYRYDDVWGIPIGVFMDSVERIQRHKRFNFVMHGIYNGCVDIKKVNKSELEWMGELK